MWKKLCQACETGMNGWNSTHYMTEGHFCALISRELYSTHATQYGSSDSDSDFFDIIAGVLQGDTFAPYGGVRGVMVLIGEKGYSNRNSNLGWAPHFIHWKRYESNYSSSHCG